MVETVDDHKRLMDAVYRRQRHIYNLSRRYFLLGRDRLIDDLDVPPNGAVLEVACGTGRNLARIADRYPTAQLYGFDISGEMLASARAAIGKAGLSRRVTLAEGDACRLSSSALFGITEFDRVVISYALSMIPDWRTALRQAFRHVRPGGELWVADFGDQAGMPDWFARGLAAWLSKFHVVIRSELADEIKTLATAEGGHAQVRPLYRGFAVLGRIRRPG